MLPPLLKLIQEITEFLHFLMTHLTAEANLSYELCHLDHCPNISGSHPMLYYSYIKYGLTIICVNTVLP